MRFIHVLWRHSFVDEPVEIYSELNQDGLEMRKIEVWRDGTARIAGAGIQQDETFLADRPTPEVDEINSDAEFVATEITAGEFEAVWRKHLHE